MNTQKIYRLDDEQGRLAALKRYEILDTEPEAEFSEICSLVQSIFNVRYAAVNLIDTDRQWTKAAAGIATVNCRRDDAFCNYTIRGAGAFIVEDTLADDRFVNNPLVVGTTSVRSYLGVPLTSPDGYNVGALCVFDTEPRKFSDADIDVLRNFAKVIISQFELRLVARLDALTGAVTRRAFIERVDRAIEAHKTDSALLMIDIDHFKKVNDTWGHPVGDVVLKRVAQKIQQILRRGDILGRLGGEEFGVLVHDVDLAAASRLADWIRSEVAALEIAELPEGGITLSLGLALRKPEESRDDWLARADAALYDAKRGGRDRWVLAQGEAEETSAPQPKAAQG